MPSRFFRPDASGQVFFRGADQEPEQQRVEQHHRDGFALPAREGEEHGDHQHQRDGHAVRPPRQVGQVAVKDDDGRKEIDEECRQARTHRQPLKNHRDDVQRPCDGADGQR